jgi:hypothetical protein
MITWADIARSVIIGQAVTISLFAVVYVVLVYKLQHPRPGRWIALLCGTISYIAALIHVAMDTFGRVGLPPRCPLILALAVVTTGTLSLSLLIAHIVFHSDKGTTYVRQWFGDYR